MGNLSPAWSLSLVQVFASPRTLAHQAPLSLGFPRQQCGSGLPFPSPGYLPDPGIKPTSLPLAGGFFTAEPPVKHGLLGALKSHYGESMSCLSGLFMKQILLTSSMLAFLMWLQQST